MNRYHLFISILFCIGISCLTVNTILLAYNSGPPDGRTGAPGESNCTVGCHSGNALNSGGGSLTINGVPDNYQLDSTYTITVTISQTGINKFGFEATAKKISDNVPAGTLTAGTGSQISGTYIKHNFSGTAGSNNSKSWTFTWKAPSSDVGEIKFYIAGNAANGNGSNTGDYIYITSKSTLSPEVTSVAELESPNIIREYKLFQNYPNPFNPITNIEFSIPLRVHVELTIYNVLGQRIKTLIKEALPEGKYKIQWNGTNDYGVSVSNGLYIYELKANNVIKSKRLSLLK